MKAIFQGCVLGLFSVIAVSTPLRGYTWVSLCLVAVATILVRRLCKRFIPSISALQYWLISIPVGVGIMTFLLYQLSEHVEVFGEFSMFATIFVFGIQMSIGGIVVLVERMMK